MRGRVRGPLLVSLALTAALLLGAGQPRHAAALTLGPFAYVTNEVGNSVSVIDTSSNTVVATIPVGSAPFGVAVTPDGAHVYVTNEGSNSVSVIATATNTVVGSPIAVGTNPIGVAVTPDGAHVYVANVGSNNVSVIATASNTVVATIPVGNGPFGVAVTPDGAHVYVTNEGSNSVSVIATATNTVVGSPIAVGSFPFGVAVTPDGAHVYVANVGSNNVSVIATASNTVVATVPVGNGPEGVAVTPDSSHVYVANAFGNSVSVIATASNTVVATVPVGSTPVGVAVTPDGAHVYVANEFSNSVSVIATASNTVVGSPIAVGSIPLAFGPFIGPALQTPAITSANATSFTVGTAGSFTVTTSGVPPPALSATGALPGGVTFLDNGNGTATLAGTPGPGTAASYPLTLTASNGFLPNATQAFTLTVVPAPTSTTLTPSPNPATFGQPVTVAVTVGGCPTPPTGPLTLTDLTTSTTLGTHPLVAADAGSFSFTTSTLAVGSHSLQASYAGNSSCAASTSPAVSETITALASGLSLTAAPNPSTVGQSVTLTATLSGGGTGSISFLDGSTVLATVALNAGGVASFSTAALSLGSHSLTASYPGDATHAPQTSAPLLQQVNPAGASVSLASSANPIPFGQSLSLTASVSGCSAPITGTLSLSDGGTTLATHPLVAADAGSFSFVLSGLSAGTHALQVSYSGSASCAASTSAVLSQVVGVVSVGASQSGIGCANSTLASDIAFPTSPNGTLASGNQLLSGPPVTPGTTPAALSLATPLGVVECGAVFEDAPVSGSAVADADPSTLPGGSITYSLSTATASTTVLTGQPLAVLLESNSSTAALNCGSTSAPSGGGAGGLESCQGAVLLLAGGPPAIPGPGCVAALSCSYAVPSAGNLVHVGLRSGASFPLVGGGSPVLTLSATYTRFSSLGSLPGISAAPTLSTGNTAIGLTTAVYSATLTAAPSTIPAASGTGQGSTLTAALFHTATTSCQGIAGFVVTVPGGFVVCPTAAAVAGGAAGAILQTAAGAESGVVTFTTTSGVFGSTSASAGTSGQQVFSTHCGQLPGTAPLTLLPTLGQPFSTSTPFTSACLSATAVLYGGGSAGTATVAASYVGDITGGTAVASTTVQLSPTGNSVSLSRGCNEVITPASTALGASVAAVVSTVQPGGIVLSAWQFSNGLHTFQAGYFAAAGAPTDIASIGPNQSLFLCVSGSGTFPTGAF